MDKSTAIALNDMNKRFYDVKAEEFSASRNNSWRGWQRVLVNVGLLGDGAVDNGVFADDKASKDEAADFDSRVGEALNVLDVACGNARFETWLNKILPAYRLTFVATDACRSLLPEALPGNVQFWERDIVASLLEPDGTDVFPPNGRFDLVVSFGFMHHIPGVDARVSLVERMLSATRPGGHVVVSFWRFADEEGLAARAEESTRKALVREDLKGLSLDLGDYLLGFGGTADVFRYCHSFTSEDIDGILQSIVTPFEVVTRFFADGRTNALNEYVVLRKK